MGCDRWKLAHDAVGHQIPPEHQRRNEKQDPGTDGLAALEGAQCDEAHRHAGQEEKGMDGCPVPQLECVGEAEEN